jgi:hypothetical protein
MKSLCFALLLPFGALAATPVAEAPRQLDSFKVSETPFAKWGLGITTQVNLWSKLTGNHAPPRIPYVVTSVYGHSPAEQAGLHVGDQIVAVDGVGFKKIPVREFGELFEKTESGQTRTLLLQHPVTNRQRTVVLKLDSGRKWFSDEKTELNYWGVKLVFPSTVKVSGTMDPPPTELQAATFKWGGQAVTLVEHPGRGVEVIEGAWSTRKLRERRKAKNAPTGRILPPGAVLTLKPDGEYELRER